MQISSGIYSGQKLFVPNGKHIRPTLTKIRQAIFNMIRDKLADATVVDFFAGTGAFGLEALSNGAAKVIFIENKYKDIIYKNAFKLKIEKEKMKIINCNFFYAFKILEKLSIKADIIFADPPYNKGYLKKFLNLIEINDILIKNGLIILEIHKDEYNIIKEKLFNFKIMKEKKYGEIYIDIFTKNGE